MSYKYCEVVDLIKKSKKKNFPTIIWPILLTAVGIIGSCLFGYGSLVGYQDSCGVYLSVIGFIIIWIFIVLSLILSHLRQPKERAEVAALLKDIKRGLHSIDVKTEEDIVRLQTEIQRSIEQSDKQWEKVLSTSKWVFSIFCIKPVSYMLSVTLKPVFESILNDAIPSNNRIPWSDLIVKLLVIGILSAIIIITLSCLANSIRKFFGPYKQKWEVYHRLEDVKYIHVN